MNLADRCAILIPTHDRPGILDVSLKKHAEMGLSDLPLVVYDDASPDPDAIRRVVDQWPGSRLIRGEERIGQAAGRNILMRACEREYALVLDDDEYFLELGGLNRHVEMPPVPKCAAVTFALIRKSDGVRIVPPSVPAQTIPVFFGGTTMFHIPSVLSVGGYRSYWRYGFEEPELSFRIMAAGFQIFYDPSVLMEHNQFHGPDEARNYDEYDRLYARNALLMDTLNLPLWIGLPRGLARSLRRSLLQRGNSAVKLKGTLDGLAWTCRHWADRRPVSFSTYRRLARFSKDWLRRVREAEDANA